MTDKLYSLLHKAICMRNTNTEAQVNILNIVHNVEKCTNRAELIYAQFLQKYRQKIVIRLIFLIYVLNAFNNIEIINPALEQCNLQSSGLFWVLPSDGKRWTNNSSHLHFLGAIRWGHL